MKKQHQKRGSVLLFTTIVLVLAGISVAVLTAATTNNVLTVRRSEKRIQAVYVAESGVQRVIAWFNRPSVAPTPGYFEPFEDGEYVDDNGESVLKVENRGTYRVARNDLPNIKAVDGNGEGQEMVLEHKGEVIYLLIEPPRDDDPRGTVARVTSIGEVGSDDSSAPTASIAHAAEGDDDGIAATVEVMLVNARIPEMTVPAALVSEATAASNGLFQVNWGEIWTKGNIELNNPISNKFPNQKEDPWFAALTEEHLLYKNGYADGSVEGGSSETPVSEDAANYEIPFLNDTLHTKNNKLRDYGNLLQHQSLDFPNMDYETMKLFCLRNDFPVYQTTSDGSLIIDYDANGDPVTERFEKFFDLQNTEDPDDVDRSKLPPIYFIDTIDGKKPKPDGSNVPTIEIQGNGPYFHGFFFMAANLDMGGAGSSPTLDEPHKPDNSTGKRIPKVRTYGLMYTYGEAEFNGVGNVFGALYSEKGFQGGGNWEIWYDVDLDNPTRGRVGSKVETNLWNVTYGKNEVTLNEGSGDG